MHALYIEPCLDLIATVVNMSRWLIRLSNTVASIRIVRFANFFTGWKRHMFSGKSIAPDRKSVGSIPAGGRTVDTFFSTVSGLNLSFV